MIYLYKYWIFMKSRVLDILDLGVQLHISRRCLESLVTSAFSSRRKELSLTFKHQCLKLCHMRAVKNKNQTWTPWYIQKHWANACFHSYGIFFLGKSEATVSVKGVDFEISIVGELCESPRNARESAATRMLAKLQSMATEAAERFWVWGASFLLRNTVRGEM